MDHFTYKSGIYHAEDVSIAALAETIGTPFYCYSSATLTRHYKVFSGHFPNAKICFAVKANGNVALLKTLAKLGCGADVVSEGEIRLAIAAGIAPQNIVFSGVGKSAEEMRFALLNDIFQFNIESEPELELLNSVALSLGKKAPVAVRVNPDVDPKTHAKISTGQKTSKFGVSMQDAMNVYRKAAVMEGIKLQGVSVHIGSQLTDLAPFDQAFARIRVFIEELNKAGIKIKTVDFGGGLGIPYGKEEPPVPDHYAEIVKNNMQGLDIDMIFEPGRLLVGNAGILVTRVLYVKRSAEKIFVVVDAAMNDLIRPALYEAYHEILPVVENSRAEMAKVDIVGPVCETGDVFAEERLMKIPNSGDILVMRSAGAYGAVMASTYNARLLAPEILVNGNKQAIIRKRQSYEELLAQSLLPEWL